MLYTDGRICRILLMINLGNEIEYIGYLYQVEYLKSSHSRTCAQNFCLTEQYIIWLQGMFSLSLRHKLNVDSNLQPFGFTATNLPQFRHPTFLFYRSFKRLLHIEQLKGVFQTRDGSTPLTFSWVVGYSVTRLGDFFKFMVKWFLLKVAQMHGEFLG